MNTANPENRWTDKAAFFLYAALIMAALALSPVAFRIFGWGPFVLGLLGAALYVARTRRLFAIDLPLTGVLLGVCIMGGLSVMWSDAPALSLERAGEIPPLLLGGWLLIHATKLHPARYFAPLSRVLVAAYVAGLFLMLFEIVSGGFFNHLFSGIPMDERANASATNHAAVILSVMLWPAVYAVWLQTSKCWPAVALALSGVAVCLMSSSETAMVAGLAGLVVLAGGLFLPKFARALAGAGAVFGVLIMPVFILLMSGLWPDAVLQWHGAHVQHRLVVYERVAQAVVSAPWLGHGLEAAQEMTISHAALAKAGMGAKSAGIYHPHNGALQLWLEMGVAGALLGCAAIMLMMARIAVLGKRAGAVALATFSSALIVAFVGYGLWQSWLLGLFFFAAMAVMIVAGADPDKDLASRA